MVCSLGGAGSNLCAIDLASTWLNPLKAVFWVQNIPDFKCKSGTVGKLEAAVRPALILLVEWWWFRGRSEQGWNQRCARIGKSYLGSSRPPMLIDESITILNDATLHKNYWFDHLSTTKILNTTFYQRLYHQFFVTVSTNKAVAVYKFNRANSDYNYHHTCFTYQTHFY